MPCVKSPISCTCSLRVGLAAFADHEHAWLVRAAPGIAAAFAKFDQLVMDGVRRTGRGDRDGPACKHDRVWEGSGLTCASFMSFMNMEYADGFLLFVY